MSNTENQTCPKTWLAESILVTLFCCLPFGIVGIVHASKVSTLFAMGKYEMARQASVNAAKWTKISFFVGLVVTILSAVFYLATFATIKEVPLKDVPTL